MLKQLTGNNLIYLSKVAIFMLLIMIVSSSTCHYSCSSCISSAYFNCLSCSDPTLTMTVTESTSLINPIYLSTLYDVGICVGNVPSGTNALGVIIILIGLISLIFIRNSSIFYIYSTIQTMGLFSLI